MHLVKQYTSLSKMYWNENLKIYAIGFVTLVIHNDIRPTENNQTAQAYQFLPTIKELERTFQAI